MKHLKEQGKNIGKIWLLMYGITAIMLFLLAVLLQNLQIGMKGITAGVTVVYVVSCFFGGFLAGKIKRQKKFMWGLLMGILYVLSLLAVTLLIKEGPAMTFAGFLSTFLICAGAGMLGGMIS